MKLHYIDSNVSTHFTRHAQQAKPVYRQMAKCLHKLS